MVADSGIRVHRHELVDRIGENGHAEFNISILCILQEFSARAAQSDTYLMGHPALRIALVRVIRASVRYIARVSL